MKAHPLAYLRRIGIAVVLLAASPGVAQVCSGDCNDDGVVAVNEIITGTNIVLGNAPFSSCLDANADGEVRVNDLIVAVNNALCSCRTCPTPQPTSTPSATRATSTPTETPTPPMMGTVLFVEGWQRAPLGTYRPRADIPTGGDLISGDSGEWLVFDSITSGECGESPHFSEIVDRDGSRRLRIFSGNSGNTDCADNIGVVAVTADPFEPRGVDAELDERVFLSFHESGGLSTNEECDAVLLHITFDRRERISYVLHRGPGWDTRFGCDTIFAPNPLLLDPGQAEHTRNLMADVDELFLDTPSRITGIALEVDSHGTATFDDIRVFRSGSPCTCTTVIQGTWCLEDRFGEVENELTQTGCRLTFGELRGQICGTHWVVDNLECDFDAGNPATQCAGFDDVGSVFMHAGPCDDVQATR